MCIRNLKSCEDYGNAHQLWVPTNSMDIVIHCSMLVISRPQQFPMFDKFQFVVAYIHTLLLICCQEWGPLSYSPIREGLSILSHFLSLKIHLYYSVLEFFPSEFRRLVSTSEGCLKLHCQCCIPSLYLVHIQRSLTNTNK